MILTEGRSISTTLFPLLRFISSGEYLLSRETERTAQSQRKFSPSLAPFQMLEKSLGNPRPEGKLAFSSAICDTACYCVA